MENSAEVKTWIQKHERLIIVLIAALVIAWLGSKWLDHSANVADTKADQTAQELATVVQSNKDIAATVKQVSDGQVALVQALSAQNLQLMDAISKRGQAAQQQQQKDQTMPLPDLGVRWSGLLSLSPNEFTARPDNTITASENAARKTVQQLELVPALQQTIEDGKQIVANKDKQIEGSTQLNNSLTLQVNGLQNQLKAADSNCKAQMDKVKADGRRSKRNWFIRGAAIGASIAAYFLH